MENVDQKLLSSRVKALRRIARYSQEEVASKLGISLYNYKHFEEGSKTLSEEGIVILSKLFHQDLAKIDCEIILAGQNHQLTRVRVKKENRYFINEIARDFIKLDLKAQELVVQIIQKLLESA